MFMNKNKLITLLTVFLYSIVLNMNYAYSQASSTGVFENNSDIGAVQLPGGFLYDPALQEYTIHGSGENIWFGSDEFHFLWKRMQGNFIMRTRVRFVGDGVHEHRKIGIMIRDTLSTGSAHVSAVVHGDGLTSLQFRRAEGGTTEESIPEISYADIIQIERRGDTFIMSAARYGEPFTIASITGISLDSEVYAGLFICSHDPDVVEKAVFDNVRIIIPARDDFVPYKDYIGSNIEIMDVQTGHREILYSSPLSLQAPNWSRDGSELIYNSSGLIYGIDIRNKTVREINTGFANNNNNDHVLSFDGKMLGISHHSADDEGLSIIYTLPSGGGTPERITALGPSYLHGFSPDGEYLVFTGERAGNYDIYKISRILKEEIRLTAAEGLDDGSEYGPDGKYIYFNSSRTGTMQIWRMRPDGSDQQQMTFDELNDWFPHVSPDGKNIVFLSFGKEVSSGDHPFYKHVYIRMMPAAGGTPKIIAYVYGGQGTINVHSWSPDGGKIAFVSNTVIE
jgi:TolB protein